MPQITRAIIPVAGWGSRRLPITKVIEKSMLPIGNRPLVDYIVQDCIEAGIRDIYFVVSEADSQVERYYSTNEKLESYLRAQNKTAQLALVQPPANVQFHFVVQDVEGKYGTSVPVAQVTQIIGTNEPVLVVMGDDFLFTADKTQPSDIQRLLNEYSLDGEAAIIGVELANDEDVSKYGVLQYHKDNGRFEGIVEKPAADQAPSRLINVSKYVLTPAFLKKIAEHVNIVNDGGEYYITEPISWAISEGEAMRVVSAQGQYLDGGSVEGWLHANNVVCKAEGVKPA